MIVAELVAQIEARGNLRQEMNQARTAVRDLERGAQATEQQLQRMEVPANLRRDTQLTARELVDMGRSADTTRTQLRRVEMPDTVRREARQAAGEVREIGQQASRAANEVDEIGNAARAVAGEVSRSGIGNAFRDQLSEMAASAETNGAAGGGEFVAGFAAKLKGLGGKGGPIAAALLAVVGVGVVAGGKLAEAVQQGFEAQGARDFSQAQFGFSDAQMAQAGQAAGGAFGNAWGASVQDNINTAGTAIQAGLLDGDATAAEMQPVIEQLTFVSDIMGTEIPETARAAGQMIKTGLVETPAEAFDLLTAAQQKGLNLSDDLLDTMNEYGTQFRKLGIDGEQAMGLISQAVRGGARDTDIAADAIKEFSIRVLDGSELTNGAFEALGLNAEETAQEFGKGGEAALNMSDKVIDALRAIEDPVKRNEVGVALFGTQWEDLGAAINEMDLSKARNELDMAGKAAEGMGTAGGGAAATIEAAKNRISMAADQVKLKLAEAFAPMATDAASWVAGHQEEILMFFSEIAKQAMNVTAAVLDIGGGFLYFASTAVEQTTKVLQFALWPTIKMLGMLGSAMSHLPGEAGKVGEGMVKAADGAEAFMEELSDTGSKMRDTGSIMFDLADKVRQGTITMDEFQTRMATAEAVATSLGGELGFVRQSVLDIPDDKSIVISDNSPETVQKLKDLGFTVQTLPDGSVKVIADDAEAKEKLRLITEPASKVINIEVKDDTGLVYSPNITPQQRRAMRADGAITRNAHGSVMAKWIDKPTNADIFQPPVEGSMMFAERETGGESYIPLAPGKRARSEAILGKTAEIFGLGLHPLKRMADGGLSGINQSIWDVVSSQFPDATLNSGTREGDSGFHGLGAAIDVGGPMQEVADFMFSNYKDQLAQIIWGPGPNLYNVKADLAGTGVAYSENPEADGIYDSGTMAGHWDHVHIAAEQPITPAGDAPGDAAMIQGAVGLTADSSREDAARAIIGEGRKRGYSDDEIKAVLATAVQESNLEAEANGGGGAWHGYFQQDASYPGRDDPNTNITGFYDRLDEKRAAAPGGDIWKDIFWLQQRPGETSAEAAVANGRAGYMEEIQGRSGEAGALFDQIAPSVGTLGASDPTSSGTSVSTSSGVQKVEVINWPTSLGGTPAPAPEDEAIARFGLALYSNGGTVGHPGSPLQGFGSDTVLAGLTPDEEVIPAGPAKIHRRLLKAIARGELARFADGGTVGGFGGYTTEGAEYHKAYNWMDLIGLGGGAGFTAMSVVDESGKYKGFDSSNTSIPGEAKLLEDLKKIAEKPTVVIEHAEIKADNPQQLVDRIRQIDPATAEVTRRNL